MIDRMKYRTPALHGALWALLLSLRASAGVMAPVTGIPAYITAAVADASRPAEDRQLDLDRKPAEVLSFAQVHPGEIVAEFLPGGGYYTRLLSDIVGSKGRIYALETTTWGDKNVAATKAVVSGRGNVQLDLAPLGTFKLPEKVGLFWTSLNYHDLHVPKYAQVDIAAFNKLVFDSLRPGGIYLIEDHAAAPGAGATLSATLHRIEEKTVVDEVTAAGFKLISRSDLLHRSADDRSKVVFDPSIRMKTDQFILKFRHP